VWKTWQISQISRSSWIHAPIGGYAVIQYCTVKLTIFGGVSRLQDLCRISWRTTDVGLQDSTRTIEKGCIDRFSHTHKWHYCVRLSLLYLCRRDIYRLKNEVVDETASPWRSRVFPVNSDFNIRESCRGLPVIVGLAYCTRPSRTIRCSCPPAL
jgi:hypothetical protein